MRPQNADTDDNIHSSDVADDHELELSHADLKEALATRIGGRGKKEDDCERDAHEKGSHHTNSIAGIGIAQGAWAADHGGLEEPTFIPPDSIENILKEAKHPSPKRSLYTYRCKMLWLVIPAYGR